MKNNLKIKIFLASFIVVCIMFYFVKTKTKETFIQFNDNYTEERFHLDVDLIQKTIQKHFPSVKIDPSIQGDYFKNVTVDDMKTYNNFKKWNWDRATEQLYRDYLEKQGYLYNNNEFYQHILKMKTVYNQKMILEMLSTKTDQNQLFQNGLLVNEQNEILQPVRQNWKDYYINNDTFFGNKTNKVIQCNNNRLKMFDKSKDSFLNKDYQGRDISADLFASSIDYLKDKCNPCESNHLCQYKIKFKNNFENDLYNKIWQS